ncbi:MAG: trypsin-like peptidase domain-containing protein [Anaerolineaceae bacterium]|nr:trypsin-like peptidase domain-containing protein [Anaerolineaceae bacterium]MBN2677124.1 trypsin-like peptidase domain-containing protein [Anaerolineaceae bacterium]
MNRIIRVLIAILSLIVILSCQTITTEVLPDSTEKTTDEIPTYESFSDTPTFNTIPVPDLANVEEILTTLYTTVDPGIVAIQVITAEGEGLGSGFVIDYQGHIVTNYHVVEGEHSIEVDFPSGYKTYGEVIGTDLDSDLAVIKVDVADEELHPLTLGDSSQLKVGQTVIAIGNPYGLTGTMTVGIVSALGRTLDSQRQTESGAYYTAADLIQTDASINPGNSGGPLLNLNGEVVGVNRAIQTAGSTMTGAAVNTGIGFAIASNIVKRVVPSLIKFGSYDYPYLGITSREVLNLTAMEALGITHMGGAYVVNVSAGGPASRAGIRGGTRATSITGLVGGGDLIIAADGRPVNVFSDLLSYLVNNKSPGDTITLTVLRNGEEMDIDVVLGSRR